MNKPSLPDNAISLMQSWVQLMLRRLNKSIIKHKRISLLDLKVMLQLPQLKSHLNSNLLKHRPRPRLTKIVMIEMTSISQRLDPNLGV